MTLSAIAWAAGAAALQTQAALPPLALALVLLPLALIALKWPRTSFAFAFAAGFMWAAAAAHQRMADRLAPELEGRDLVVSGVVSGLPAPGERNTRFELEIEASSGGKRLPQKVLVSWYHGAALDDEEGAAPMGAAVHPGERWLFTLRLRRPHGNVNPNGFDYEAWLLERGIGATGYVRARGEHRKIGERASLLVRVEQAREAVRDRFIAHLGATPAAGILAALAVGDQR